MTEVVRRAVIESLPAVWRGTPPSVKGVDRHDYISGSNPSYLLTKDLIARLKFGSDREQIFPGRAIDDRILYYRGFGQPRFRIEAIASLSFLTFRR